MRSTESSIHSNPGSLRRSNLPRAWACLLALASEKSPSFDNSVTDIPPSLVSLKAIERKLTASPMGISLSSLRKTSRARRIFSRAKRVSWESVGLVVIIESKVLPERWRARYKNIVIAAPHEIQSGRQIYTNLVTPIETLDVNTVQSERKLRHYRPPLGASVIYWQVYLCSDTSPWLLTCAQAPARHGPSTWTNRSRLIHAETRCSILSPKLVCTRSKAAVNTRFVVVHAWPAHRSGPVRPAARRQDERTIGIIRIPIARSQKRFLQ